MFGPAAVASALAAAVVAWGVPTGVSPPAPDSFRSIFGPDPAPGSDGKGYGELDKEVVFGVIRGHFDAVKACYGHELSRQPDLSGTITVQFTIAASGQVVSSVLRTSTMGNARVETCIVEEVRHWQFPKPRGGGIVTIQFPFVLTPATAKATATMIVTGTNGAGAVEIQTITPTLYVHRSTDANAVPSNGLIAVAGGGLLLVDTAWTEEQTEAILSWGDGYFRRPWIGAVITHDHGDRAGGLAALERRRIPVAAMDLTVAKLTRRGVRGVTTLFLARDGGIKDPRGFEAFYPGPGHASDNIVLRFDGLVFGGCLVKSMAATDLGFTGDADLETWPIAIRKVSARYADLKIVPGHGPLDWSGQAYQHTLDLLAARKSANTGKK